MTYSIDLRKSPRTSRNSQESTESCRSFQHLPSNLRANEKNYKNKRILEKMRRVKLTDAIDSAFGTLSIHERHL